MPDASGLDQGRLDPSRLDRRRRTIEAMGLGPLWTLRSAKPASLPLRLPLPPRSGDDRLVSIAAMDRDALVEAVTTCRACALCESRTHAVFGVGSAEPQWLVVGDAPSREDDQAAAPLTGPAGRLLDAMLAAVDRSRQQDVFVTTAVKCRPPDDREPLPIEIATCRPFLDRQIALMSPRVLLAIGEPAARALSSSADAARGEVLAVVSGERTMPAVVTHHPSRLLAEPRLKADAWADLCAARAI